MASNTLASRSWKSCEAFKNTKKRETQTEYYTRNAATPAVMSLVSMQSVSFGSKVERIICEVLNIGPRTSPQNDGTVAGRKVEIKTARFWASKDECIWQHIEPEHDYEFAIFVLLEFRGFKVWAITKENLKVLMDSGKVVTFQGKQGWWTRKSQVLPHLTPIADREQLLGFVEKAFRT